MARPRQRKREPEVVDARAFLDDMVGEEGREGLRKAIIDLAAKLRYFVHHCYDSRLCGPHKGMPDLILVGFGRVIFIELKKQTGRVSWAQYSWANALAETPVEYYLWRPSDWSNGTVERILAPAA